MKTLDIINNSIITLSTLDYKLSVDIVQSNEQYLQIIKKEIEHVKENNTRLRERDQRIYRKS